MHYKFGWGAPLQKIIDRYSNSITLTRAGTDGSVQRGNVTTITASNGRSLQLYYGGSPSNCCITGFGASGQGDPQNRNIQYAYTSSKQLKTVNYPNLDPTNQNAKITYSWSASHPNLLGLIAVNVSKPGGSVVTNYINPAYDTSTTIHRLRAVYPGTGTDVTIGVQYAYTISNQKVTNFNVTFADGSHRKFTVDAKGYITQDVRNSSNAQHTETFNYTRDLSVSLRGFIDYEKEQFYSSAGLCCFPSHPAQSERFCHGHGGSTVRLASS